MFFKFKSPGKTSEPSSETIEWMRRQATPEALSASLKRALVGADLGAVLEVSVWWDEPGTIRVNYRSAEPLTDEIREECNCVGSEILSDFPDVAHFIETFSTSPIPLPVSVQIKE